MYVVEVTRIIKICEQWAMLEKIVFFALVGLTNEQGRVVSRDHHHHSLVWGLFYPYYLWNENPTANSCG